MAESDTDSDCELKRASSLKIPTQFEFVPESLEFRFKLVSNVGGHLLDKFCFELKEGKKLPYSVVLEGRF